MGFEEFGVFVWANLVGLKDDGRLVIIMVWIIVNTVASSMVALNKGWFVLAKLWEFTYRKLLPAIAMYVTAKVFGDVIGLGELFAWTMFTFICSWLFSNFMDSCKQMGWPSPDWLTKVRMPTANAMSRGVLPPDA